MAANGSGADGQSKLSDRFDEIIKRQGRVVKVASPLKDHRTLCTSLEQASAFLLMQCLVTWEVAPLEPQGTCVL